MALSLNGRPSSSRSRRCSHSGCPDDAVATLSFDYATRRAWLHELPDPPDPASYDLCSGHVARFRPPRGWEMEDQRGTGRNEIDAAIEEELFQADVSL